MKKHKQGRWFCCTITRWRFADFFFQKLKNFRIFLLQAAFNSDRNLSEFLKILFIEHKINKNHLNHECFVEKETDQLCPEKKRNFHVTRSINLLINFNYYNCFIHLKSI